MIEYIKFQLKWYRRRLVSWLNKYRSFNHGIPVEFLNFPNGRKSDTVIFTRMGDICIKLNGQYLPTTNINISQVVDDFPKITITFIPSTLQFDDIVVV
jgi:hypothetical protein